MQDNYFQLQGMEKFRKYSVITVCILLPTLGHIKTQEIHRNYCTLHFHGKIQKIQHNYCILLPTLGHIKTSEAYKNSGNMYLQRNYCTLHFQLQGMENSENTAQLLYFTSNFKAYKNSGNTAQLLYFTSNFKAWKNSGNTAQLLYFTSNSKAWKNSGNTGQLLYFILPTLELRNIGEIFPNYCIYVFFQRMLKVIMFTYSIVLTVF